jgi:polyisoprenoid-binding protein YceI
VDVEVHASGARTGLFLATEALKSAEVLDTNRFPLIRFASTSVQLSQSGRLSDGARITGDLTIRGATRPVSLEAQILRPPGTAADDLRRLTESLRGGLSRSAWGITGYPGLVDDRISLDIRAVIRAAG